MGIKLTHLSGKKAAVLGLGRSGKAIIAALRAGGAEVFAWDDNEAARAEVPKLGAMLADPDAMPWKELSCLVMSPGIPLTHPQPHPAVVKARAAGCEILCDIELLYRQCPEARYIGITGTNGKSTTTALTHYLLKQAGVPVQVGGNIGTAALLLEPMGKEGTYVLELSSYQLDLLHQLHCNIAIWLNLTPDHIDRHGDLQGYMTAKRRIFQNMTAKDVAVVGVDDVPSSQIAKKLEEKESGQRVVALSMLEGAALKNEYGILEKGERLKLKMQEGEAVFDLSGINSLRGRHNAQNAAAAAAAALVCGLSQQQIQQGLKSFPGLAHRMEVAGEKNGVLFVNDSKATNAEAAEKALISYDNIYWIAGGVPKEGGITSLAPHFGRIRKAYLIGQAAEEFARTLEGKVSYAQCGTLEKAVQEAARDAANDKATNKVVLLSPACASFDQWRDFEQRGEGFKGFVKEILARDSKG